MSCAVWYEGRDGVCVCVCMCVCEGEEGVRKAGVMRGGRRKGKMRRE